MIGLNAFWMHKYYHMYRHYLFAIATTFIFLSFKPTAKFVSRTGHLHVESNSRFLDVIADNYQVYSELDPLTGSVEIQGLMKSFEFKMGALDRAFNSKHVDLGKYTNFRYEGKIVKFKRIKFDTPGQYSAEVNGILYIGGYKRKTPASGTVIIKEDGSIRVEASLPMRIEEASVNTINKMMKEKLPSIVSVDADKLGLSREIVLAFNANYRSRG